jgi:hypothetical protein
MGLPCACGMHSCVARLANWALPCWAARCVAVCRGQNNFSPALPHAAHQNLEVSISNSNPRQCTYRARRLSRRRTKSLQPN